MKIFAVWTSGRNCIICTVLVLAALLLLNIERRIGLLDKNPYDSYINEYSSRFGVDLSLVKAIMKKESNLNASAVSNKGAVGLMQIMPKTALEIATQLNITDYSYAKLQEPKINIMFGVCYINKLLKYYNNNLILALAAYNAGIGNVDNWYAENPNISKRISKIPFKETRRYVRSIIYTYRVYQKVQKLRNFLVNL
jgi:soluble lytic murein transglycosylase